METRRRKQIQETLRKQQVEEMFSGSEGTSDKIDEPVVEAVTKEMNAEESVVEVVTEVLITEEQIVAEKKL